ncbi:hypothetical protein FCG40_05490 [Fimbriimonadia bacterium ATM]|nr:MAG: hypothetical protein EDM73_07620 [Armatimonadota bacterium]MBC6969957.1 hypothetical protein [Armatimonadota bacterium]MCE7900269.1 hypothetical protein [Armatimonadetes bacterium ATM1]MDL1928424.1 hypothetical protein [Fimbriimonadia bacterium ATM]RIJ96644.1 MAG: hypothetical protein DCC45_06350 [Armatimonadota bacterium]
MTPTTADIPPNVAETILSLVGGDNAAYVQPQVRDDRPLSLALSDCAAQVQSLSEAPIAEVEGPLAAVLSQISEISDAPLPAYHSLDWEDDDAPLIKPHAQYFVAIPYALGGRGKISRPDESERLCEE